MKNNDNKYKDDKWDKTYKVIPNSHKMTVEELEKALQESYSGTQETETYVESYPQWYLPIPFEFKLRENVRKLLNVLVYFFAGVGVYAIVKHLIS